MKILKNILIVIVLCSFSLLEAQQKSIELLSPDGKIRVTANIAGKINLVVSSGSNELFRSDLQMELRTETLGKNPKLTAHKYTSVDTEIKPVVPFKFSTVKNRYNGLTLDFKGNYSVEIRAFDDGIAYRFITRKKGTVEVMREDCNLSFPERYLLHLQYAGENRGFAAVYEEPYSHVESDKWSADSMMAVLPLLIDTRRGEKILFSEADINDYPNMFLSGRGTANGVTSAFPPAPTKMRIDSAGNTWISEEADYIAKTKGSREFPWRWFIVSHSDGQLLESAMVARLAPKCALDDVSWIKPGQAFWDYINRSTDYGPHVTYRQGINTPTYKRYIDFAAKNKIQYVLIDAAWAKDHSAYPTLEVVPELDLPEVIKYAKSKNVEIILWMYYHPVQRDLNDDSFNMFEYYSKMGVAGLKIDFMDRSDQWIVNFYEQAAREAAKCKMVLEFHGSYKPVGLEYKYPNVLSYEGVRGLEYGGGTSPENSIYLPFMRNVTGPTSFTPGSMLNTQPEHLRTGWGYNWATIGTRVHHMAYYIVLESGMLMIADSPRRFEENPDCAGFIFSVPVTWDETRAVAAEVGQYAIVAKRKGDRWWIGGITNDSEKRRDFHVTLDFLNPNKKYRITSFEDGPNANGQAMDYNLRSMEVQKGDVLDIRMMRNGGWAAVIE
ncbi:MAG: glycoside hydrolase family 97 protein [Prevotellaceae bacterium]|jgi:alpha-glucosidase|nr:glycoside hydrolase family 97 protein [Prevotellaceae bacterium]